MTTDNIINLIKSIYTMGYVEFEPFGSTYLHLYTDERIIRIPRDITYALVAYEVLKTSPDEGVARFRLSSDLSGLPSLFINNPKLHQVYINEINELMRINRELTIDAVNNSQ